MKGKNKDSFQKMIEAGELFKKSLGISEKDLYELLKKIRK